MTSLLKGDADSLKYMPIGITRLTSLRTLEKFVVGPGVDYSRTYDLESLKHVQLLRECSIEALGNVSDLSEARRSELYKRKNLICLRLRFGGQGTSKKGAGRMRMTNNFLKAYHRLRV